MKTILFVVTNSALNRGMNTGLENLAWALGDKGYNIHVLTGGRAPETPKYNISKTITYHFIGKKVDSPSIFRPLFKKIINEYHIDIVIGWIINIASLVSITSNENISFIANQGQMAPRSINFTFIKKVLKRKMSIIEAINTISSIRSFSSKVHSVVSNSLAVQQDCIRAYNLDYKKCKVIPRGVDTDTYYPFDETKKSENKYNLLYTGNINKKKGVTDIINALQFIDFPIRVTLCGKATDDYIKELKVKVSKCNVRHELDYAGIQSQESLVDYLNHCDIFVFPSYSEGLPKALLEAMSCGCAIVCSNIKPHKEIVTHGYDGLITQVKAPEQLAESIKNLLSDSKKREELRLNARRTVKQNFSKEDEINRWVKHLDRL